MDYISQAPKCCADENGLIFTTNSLYEYLRNITDTRQAKGKRYSFPRATLASAPQRIPAHPCAVCERYAQPTSRRQVGNWSGGRVVEQPIG